MSTAIALPKKTQLRTKKELDEAQEIFDNLEDLIVEDKDDIEFASKMLREVKGKKKFLEGERGKVTYHLNEALEIIRSWFRDPIKLLTQCEKILKEKIDDAMEEMERKQQEALDKASKAAMSGKKSSARRALEDAKAAEIGPIEGIQVRAGWDYEIVDFNKIPRKWLCVDDPMLKAHIRSKKGDVQIPGIKVIKKNSIAANATK